MAFAGNDTYFAGIIGSDGDLLKDALVDKGVHIDYMKISNVNQQACNYWKLISDKIIFFLYGGTNKEIDFEYIDEVFSFFKG